MLAETHFKTPTLVVHSQLDYRLDVSEGYQLFDTLQRMKVPSKMLYFPDEGHWVMKPQNSQLWYKTVNDWVDQWTQRLRRHTNDASSLRGCTARNLFNLLVLLAFAGTIKAPANSARRRSGACVPAVREPHSEDPPPASAYAGDAAARPAMRRSEGRIWIAASSRLQPAEQKDDPRQFHAGKERAADAESRADFRDDRGADGSYQSAVDIPDPQNLTGERRSSMW